MDDNQVAPTQGNPQPNPVPTQATNAPVAGTTQPSSQVGMAPAQAPVANNVQPSPQVAAAPVQQPVVINTPPIANPAPTQPFTAANPAQPVANPAPIQPAQAPLAQQPAVAVAVPKTSFWLKPILKRPIIIWTLIVYLALLAIVNIYKLIDGFAYNNFITSWVDDILVSYYHISMFMFGISIAALLAAAVIIWLKKKWGLWLLLGLAGTKLIYTIVIGAMFGGKLVIDGEDMIVGPLVAGVIGMLVYAILAALLAFLPAWRQIFDPTSAGQPNPPR